MTDKIRDLHATLKGFTNQLLGTSKNETNENNEEETMNEETKEVEEYVWVDGYKGMDKNMQCYGGFQYEVGKRYDMPEGSDPEVCERGFHMCMTLTDVFEYVPIRDNNRFFQVRALVRKKDMEAYGTPRSWIILDRIDKLAAKSIEIVRELTDDEILKRYGGNKWSDEYKGLARAAGVKVATHKMDVTELISYGYSVPFADYIVKNKKFEVAKAVGSQPDLSMDMKVLMIMNG